MPFFFFLQLSPCEYPGVPETTGCGFGLSHEKEKRDENPIPAIIIFHVVWTIFLGVVLKPREG